MAASTQTDRWLPHFRRSLAFLRAHRRTLILGLLSAIGVSATYTFTISAIVPVLKVIVADHETLVDWVNRITVEHRLGVVIPPDLPDDPRGLPIVRTRADAPADERLYGAMITAVQGEAGSTYGLLERLARAPTAEIALAYQTAEGPETTTLLLRPPAWWHEPLHDLAALLPAGRNTNDRLLALAAVLGVFIGMNLLRGIFRFFNDALVKTAVQRGLHDLRTAVADHVLRLPMAWHANQPPGDTLARLATDLNKVEVGQTTLFGKLIREPLKALGVLSLTLLIDWQLLVIALLGLPVAVLLIRVFGRMVKRAQRQASQSWGRLLDHLGERLAGIRVVKASNMEAAESRRFEREGRNLTAAQTQIEMIDAATNPALEVLAILAASGFVLFGASRVFAHELEPHLFFAAVICLAGVFDPIRKLGNVNNRLHAADASANRLFELMDLAPETTAAAPAVARPEITGAVAFDGVSFAYGPDRPLVLRDVSFSAAPGEMLAIVGPNGSGKTTLVSLLLRFYEPSAGRILIDGQELRTFSLEQLRGCIGYVTQEAIVFSATLRENIAYGENGIPEERIRHAARAAHVEDFAGDLRGTASGEATCGYDAGISARTLSGGQRQRIALARAILRDPPILILDEATSQVDSESERKIQEALDTLTRNRTTFIIAHRFSTIAKADRIAVLNEGRLVGLGRHAELLESCPLYQSLCQTQFAHGA